MRWKTSILLVFLVATLALPFFSFEVPTVHASPAYEDWTDVSWSEVDANNNINFTANHIDFHCRRDEVAYLVKDYGASHFDDFEHLIDANVTDGFTQAGDSLFFWLLSNYTEDVQSMITNTHTFIAVRFYGNIPRLYVTEYDGSWNQDYDSISMDTNYYFEIKKTGTSFFCEVYTDSDRTTLDTNLSITLSADYNFRYLYSAVSQDSSNDYWGTGCIENLDLQEEEAQEKSFTLSETVAPSDTTTLGEEKLFGATDTTIVEATKTWSEEVTFILVEIVNPIAEMSKILQIAEAIVEYDYEMLWFTMFLAMAALFIVFYSKWQRSQRQRKEELEREEEELEW